MDINSVLTTISKMFPNANISEAAQKAEEAIKQTPNSLDGARATAQKYGITAQAVNEIYNKYGNTARGRAVCGLLGTTPEDLKADAYKILGGEQSAYTRASTAPQGATTKFPRLK